METEFWPKKLTTDCSISAIWWRRRRSMTPGFRRVSRSGFLDRGSLTWASHFYGIIRYLRRWWAKFSSLYKGCQGEKSIFSFRVLSHRESIASLRHDEIFAHPLLLISQCGQSDRKSMQNAYFFSILSCGIQFTCGLLLQILFYKYYRSLQVYFRPTKNFLRFTNHLYAKNADLRIPFRQWFIFLIPTFLT